MLGRGGWDERATAVLEAGREEICLHLRGPRTDGSVLYHLAEALLPRARAVGALLFVNDRVDVALAADVDGVHLGARSLPVTAARTLWPAGRWLGASTRSAAEASSARREGADYVFLGTIYPTPSHPGVAGMGVAGVHAAAGSVGDFPIVSIGGIDAGRAPEVLASGAHGIAVVRGVWEARDPAAAVARYLERMEETQPEKVESK